MRQPYAKGYADAAALFGVKSADLKTEGQPHQDRVTRRMLDENQRGLVVVHGLGSGKTRTSLDVADKLHMPADVVLPAALRGNYLKEIEKHTKAPPDAKIQSLENVARKGGGLSRPLLIVDEAHRTRNPTKTQRALMTSPAKKRLLLTGSLVYNHPSDMAGPINLAAGRNTLPSRSDDFERAFIRTKVEKPGFLGRLLGRPDRVYQDINPKTKPYLEDVLHKYVDYYPGSTENFPEKSEETVRVPMSAKQREIYDTLMGQAPAWVRHKVRAGLPPTKRESSQLNSFLAGARQVSNTTEPFISEGQPEYPKIQEAAHHLRKFLDENPRSKALVYSNYLSAGINPYKKYLDENKIPYGEFSGEMAKKQRDDLVKQYNADKLKALLLSSAGGEGLDLKGTRLIQILEPHWNDEKLKQVIGRGIRYKSHEHLPPEERKVLIQRYLSTLPRRGILEKTHLRDPGNSTDEYLNQMAANKERLNDQFRRLYADAQ